MSRPGSSRIGFVLLTHTRPHQIQRLVHRLNTMFDDPPIVIHHDFAKCPLPESFLPGNVTFVQPSVNIEWGMFSMVEAMNRALAQLYARPDSPDWTVFLSGDCYPTKPAAQILDNLNAGGLDAHINGERVGRDSPGTGWMTLRYNRYCVKRYTFRSLDKGLKPRIRTAGLPLPLGPLGEPFLPFNRTFRCYWGSQWFSLNRRAAEHTVAFSKSRRGIALAKHYQNQGMCCSDESYYQTVLYNVPEFKVGFDNWMYLDWSANDWHPKQLMLQDLPEMEASATHFARKINLDTDPELLDALDQIIDGKMSIHAGLDRHSDSYQAIPAL